MKLKLIVKTLCWMTGVLSTAPVWAGDMPKNLGCTHYAGRALSICQQMESTMEWQLLGHATVAPGWRVTFDGIAQSFCALKLEPDDEAALQQLGHTNDWRLQMGVAGLLALLHNTHNKPEAAVIYNCLGGLPNKAISCTSYQSVGSIFDTQSSAYILKQGCPAQ